MDGINNNTFYLTFKDLNPSWSLIGSALLWAIIATFGIIFNFCVIFVTIRTKAFRGTVNYLLALCSFFELLHQHGHFLFLYTALSGLNFIEYRLAAKIMSVSAFGIGGILPTMFFTGIDRLIGIGFYEMHFKLLMRPYLALITSVSSFFGIINSLLLYQDAQQYNDEMVTGCIADLFKVQILF
ncbi:hypothetical protein niasHS_003112 [Heterodera schachtii]|uniref:G_PROTEIN_RECEP_F1_2 domain-containing protein n=1 Tax=Heterodera schachtii TaxID=97005 RepID=A0ABD2K9Y9_HETSC